MLARRSLLATVCLLASSSCSSTSGALPTWDEPGNELASTPAEASNSPSPEQEPEVADVEASPVENESEPAPATTTLASSGTSEPDEGEEAKRSSGEKEKQGLPKPLHTKLDASCGKDPGIGQKLKAFELKTPGGKSVTHRTYGRRILLVNFWGTWCKPCLEELPEFDRLYRRYRKHGMTLVAIATDEEAQEVQDFVKSRKLAAKVLLGGEGYASQYGSPKFPFTFVVDEKGVIKASYRGYKPECMGQLEADIRAQLEGK